MPNRQKYRLLASGLLLCGIALMAVGQTAAALLSMTLFGVLAAAAQFGLQFGGALILALCLCLPAATLLVNGGRAIITNLVSGLGGTVPKFVAWGTGAGTTGATDTTLFTESSEARTSGTVTQQTTTTTNDSYRVVGTITATGARTITNAGLFDASTSGNLFFKTDFTGIVLATNDSIQFTITTSFS